MSTFLDDYVFPICLVHYKIYVNQLNIITSCETAFLLKQVMLLQLKNILLNFIAGKNI